MLRQTRECGLQVGLFMVVCGFGYGCGTDEGVVQKNESKSTTLVKAKTLSVESSKRKQTPAKPKKNNAASKAVPKTADAGAPNGKDLPTSPSTSTIDGQVAKLIGEWKCETKQPMMEMRTDEVFQKDQRSKSEGGITFSAPNGPVLQLYMTGKSRWRVTKTDGAKVVPGSTGVTRVQRFNLCEVPLEIDFAQVSGAENVHVDQLLASMKKQGKARIQGNLETCRDIVSISDTDLVLKTPQKEVETRCKREGK